MTAFDGNNNLVWVFFDSKDDTEINVALTDEPADYTEDELLRITPEQAIEVVEDLLGAVITRGRSELVDELLERIPTWKEN